jgi:hypothetical protein
VEGYRYDFDAFFCRHNPVAAGGRRRLQGRPDFLENFLGEVRRLRRGMPPAEIISRLDNGGDRKARWINPGNASFADMVRSALRAGRV